MVTTCQVNYISFNGAKLLDNVDRMISMTKHNLDCSSHMGIRFRKSKIYVVGGLSVVMYDIDVF